MTKLEVLIENSVRKVIKEEFKKLLPFFKEVVNIKESIKGNTIQPIKEIPKWNSKKVSEVLSNSGNPESSLKKYSSSLDGLKGIIPEEVFQEFLINESSESAPAPHVNTAQFNNIMNRDYSDIVKKMNSIKMK